jgi:hypothetical protein
LLLEAGLDLRAIRLVPAIMKKWRLFCVIHGSSM